MKIYVTVYLTRFARNHQQFLVKHCPKACKNSPKYTIFITNNHFLEREDSPLPIRTPVAIDAFGVLRPTPAQKSGTGLAVKHKQL